MRPGLNIAVRVEFMARQVPSQAGEKQVKIMKRISCALATVFVTSLYARHACPVIKVLTLPTLSELTVVYTILNSRHDTLETRERLPSSLIQLWSLCL